MAIIPEVLLAACILWFGVAMPQPLMTGINNAASIVMQEDVDPGDTGSLLSGVSNLIQMN